MQTNIAVNETDQKAVNTMDNNPNRTAPAKRRRE